VRMCAWPMAVSGRCMQWALKLMSPSWIHGSRHTMSNLSAPGSEAVVSARAYRHTADAFRYLVSVLASKHTQ
jgi:hypothetical protein